LNRSVCVIFIGKFTGRVIAENQQDFPMPFIHVVFNEKRIATYELDNETLTVGRTPNNDIVIDNPGVSSTHARIFKEGDDYFIEDLDSKNGTYVKGRKASQHRFDFGDVITIFKHQLQFVPIVGSDAPMAEKGAVPGMINQGATLEVDMSQHAEQPAEDGVAQHFELMLLSDDARDRIVKLSQQNYCIRKNDECLIKTSGLMAPPVSARLMRQQGGYMIAPERKDEVKLNGESLESPCRLQHGDNINIRKLKLVYRVIKAEND